MKKIISIGLVGIMLAGLLTACGTSLKADCDTVYVKKNGTVIGAAVEEFEKDYYDADELKTFIEDEVAQYQKEHEKKSVKIHEFSVKDKTAKLFIKFKGYKDYQDFNNVTLFTGTVPQALAAGYDFATEFRKVKDTKLGDTVDNSKILSSDDKVVVLSEKIDVKVDGTIKYVSSANVKIKSKDLVSLQSQETAETGNELSLVYVIYE
ncbi:MAG: hypothetical protein RR139_11680 [Lachnospiraceae bacterium]